jgi:predicted alpha/beta-fold hydrolase
MERERLTLEDADFLDIDWMRQKEKTNTKVAVLCHGLEGSSSSKYIRKIAEHLHKEKFDILAINYRGCSGEINKAKRIYHSGATDDLQEVLTMRTSDYESVFLIGFSLGGNLVLKYTGDPMQKKIPNLKKVAAVSVPLDLKGCSLEMLSKTNKLYTARFVKDLSQKAKLKNEQYPGLIDLDILANVNNVWEFDDKITAPLHGFKDAEDYYSQCNSKQFLPEIEYPALIINARDDSFLSESCYPSDQEIKNDNIHFSYTQHGGHVGFVEWRKDVYWHESEIIHFFSMQDS